MSLDRITMDFETRSKADLLVTGSYKYSLDPSTEILMISFVLKGEDPQYEDPHIWYNTVVTGIQNPPDESRAFKQLLRQIRQGVTCEAHNAGFEINIWNNTGCAAFGWPAIPTSQWKCSAAKGAYYALPRSLDNLAKALDIRDETGQPVLKDSEGYQLMLWLTSPDKKTGRWNGTRDDFLRLGRYCQTDTRTEWYCSAALPDIPAKEQEVWELDYTINARGMYCDRAVATAAFHAADLLGADFRKKLGPLTDGAVEKPTQRARIKAWALKMGVSMTDTQGTTVDKLLKEPDSKIPKKVKLVLEILRMGNRTSTAKYKAMLEMICGDDRIRDTTMYHGATTGRWTGKGLQPHNFPRGSLKAAAMLQACNDILEGLEWLSLMYEDVGKLLSDALRGALCAPPGRKLVVCDFASVEARVTAWVSGQIDLLDLFHSGGLVYENMAEQIYHRPIDADKDPLERFIGKQAILGLGFGMGWKKFRDTLREKFDTIVTAAFAKQVVKVYRAKNTRIVEGWYELEAAAIEAVTSGKPQSACKVTWYTKKYPGVGIFLHAKLPSGRSLCYPYPLLRKDATYFFSAEQTTLDEKGAHISELVSIRVSVPIGKDQDSRAIREFKKQVQANEYKVNWAEIQVGNLNFKEGLSLTFMGVNAKTKQWERQSTYGGSLMENIVQAIARDFMAEAMLRIEATPTYEVILTVHDEVVTESNENEGSFKELEHIMNELPEWADGCPIASEGWEGPRYRK